MNPTRRVLLAASLAGAANTLVPHLDRTAEAAPRHTSTVGLSRYLATHPLAFNDEFNSLASIHPDEGSVASHHKWFTDLPWTGGRTPMGQFQAAGSVLTLDQASSNSNWAMASMSPSRGEGRVFSYGYFEARMRFAAAPDRPTTGFPAIWLAPKYQVHNVGRRRHGEIDIFEAYQSAGYPYQRHFVGTVHDSTPKMDGTWDYTSHQNRNNTVPANITTTDWHTYGVLWEPGRITWFLDRRALSHVCYGPRRFPCCSTWAPSLGSADTLKFGAFSPLAEAAGAGMVLAIGTGAGWPIQLDRVSVWQ